MCFVAPQSLKPSTTPVDTDGKSEASWRNRADAPCTSDTVAVNRKMFARCPKCAHHPLPADQSLPAACPACGVILAKVAQVKKRPIPRPRGSSARRPGRNEAGSGVQSLLFHVPERVDSVLFGCRVGLLAGLAVWGLWLMTRSVPDGEIAASFIHGPLLVFHEAGHVLFRPLGEWMTVAGGTLMQWSMPVVLGIALLWKNRDPFGAAIALWLLGVSVMDSAPYLYDALHPQLTLLGGGTGEDGGHDFIFLLESLGLRHRSQPLGLMLHRLGAVIMLLALIWAGRLLILQSRRRSGVVLHE